MKYMLLIYGDENALSQEEREGCYQESLALCGALESEGHFVSAAPLHHSSTARSLKHADGKRIVTTGPFAETHEQLGGYFMVDVPTEAEALAIAERLPGGKFGTVEVRQVVELSG